MVLVRPMQRGEPAQCGAALQLLQDARCGGRAAAPRPLAANALYLPVRCSYIIIHFDTKFTFRFIPWKAQCISKVSSVKCLGYICNLVQNLKSKYSYLTTLKRCLIPFEIICCRVIVKMNRVTVECRFVVGMWLWIFNLSAIVNFAGWQRTFFIIYYSFIMFFLSCKISLIVGHCL